MYSAQWQVLTCSQEATQVHYDCTKLLCRLIIKVSRCLMQRWQSPWTIMGRHWKKTHVDLHVRTLQDIVQTTSYIYIHVCARVSLVAINRFLIDRRHRLIHSMVISGSPIELFNISF